MDSAFSFINGFFDFELEDQPDNLDGYLPMIQYLWRTAERDGTVEQVRQAIETASASPDPEGLLGSYFLPGKHETRDILMLTLEHGPAATGPSA